MPERFDHEEFGNRIHQNYDAYQTKLQQTSNKKEIALLHTNYFQGCLRDSMEGIMQSKEARRIPVKIIITILEDRGIFPPSKARDAAKICDIRDWFAHRVNIKSIEEDARELIRTIDMQHTREENATSKNEITDIAIHADDEENIFELYERLDMICSDLSTMARHEALHHGNMPEPNNDT